MEISRLDSYLHQEKRYVETKSAFPQLHIARNICAQLSDSSKKNSFFYKAHLPTWKSQWFCLRSAKGQQSSRCVPMCPRRCFGKLGVKTLLLMFGFRCITPFVGSPITPFQRFQLRPRLGDFCKAHTSALWTESSTGRRGCRSDSNKDGKAAATRQELLCACTVVYGQACQEET